LSQGSMKKALSDITVNCITLVMLYKQGSMKKAQ